MNSLNSLKKIHQVGNMYLAVIICW